MQHINSNGTLRKLAVLMSDGRYSGVTYGAAIGHVTSEAKNGGGILYLWTGDLIKIGLRERQLTLLDKGTFRKGEVMPYGGNLADDRRALGSKRLLRIEKRVLDIAPTNLMTDVTDAAHGVVPKVVAAHATKKIQLQVTRLHVAG